MLCVPVAALVDNQCSCKTLCRWTLGPCDVIRRGVQCSELLHIHVLLLNPAPNSSSRLLTPCSSTHHHPPAQTPAHHYVETHNKWPTNGSWGPGSRETNAQRGESGGAVRDPQGLLFFFSAVHHLVALLCAQTHAHTLVNDLALELVFSVELRSVRGHERSRGAARVKRWSESLPKLRATTGNLSSRVSDPLLPFRLDSPAMTFG